MPNFRKFTFIIFNIFVWIALLLPKKSISDATNIVGFDKLVQIFIFVSLFIITYDGLSFLLNKSKKSLLFITLGISMFSAIASEFAQKYLTDRRFEIMDILANLIGIFIGYILINYIFLKTKDIKMIPISKNKY